MVKKKRKKHTKDTVHFWEVFEKREFNRQGLRNKGTVLWKTGKPPKNPEDGEPCRLKYAKRFWKTIHYGDIDSIRTFDRPKDDDGRGWDRYYHTWDNIEAMFEDNRQNFNAYAYLEEEHGDLRSREERKELRMELTDRRFDNFVQRYEDHQEAYEFAVMATVACVEVDDGEGAGLFSILCQRILDLKSKGKIQWNDAREHQWLATRGARANELLSGADALSSSESEPSQPPSSSPEPPS